jgi:protein-S-isoprenylcysteine O-methyltransferase Ste14
MPLSEHEQRLLEQIERALYAEDPKFASTVRGAKMRRPSRRRRLQGAALFLLGLVLLIVGVILPLRAFEVPVISVFGFLVMFAGAVIAILGGRRRAAKAGEESTEVAGRDAGRSSFTQRMEDRFRRRFEEP